MDETLKASSRLLSLGWPIPIPNVKSGATYYLYPNSVEYQQSQDQVAIAGLCNQTAIYDFLFRRNLAGKPYEVEYARGFLDWSNTGWQTSEYFVFLLRDSNRTPVGCIDIKGNDLQVSEIGYWCSSHVTGLMTNTVKAISHVAGAVGFRTLMAFTLRDNHRSQNVLIANGFSAAGEFDDDGQRKRKYVKTLVN